MSPVFGHGRLRLYLLKLLDEAPRHGYEVIRLLQDRFMGVYAPSPGTIYPRLARLEEEGFLTHDEEDGRKIYRITDKGRAEINRRLDELDELEREITESVSGIAREVKEDVRETVRSLREELTWAARDMRREGRRPAAEETQAAREEARDHVRAAREEARERARRLREEFREDRDEQRGGATGGQSGAEDEAARDKPGWEWADWADWTDWADWPGRRRRGDRDRGGTGPDRTFETLAREFRNELRWAIRQAGALGEGAVEQLRDILEDTLQRIRTDVFGSAGPRPAEDEPAGKEEPAGKGAPTGQSKPSGEQEPNRTTEPGGEREPTGDGEPRGS